MAVRIQITLYDKLVAEAVVENYSDAVSLWSKWCCGRYNKDLPLGGALMMPMPERKWNVPVGEVVNV